MGDLFVPSIIERRRLLSPGIGIPRKTLNVVNEADLPAISRKQLFTFVDSLFAFSTSKGPVCNALRNCPVVGGILVEGRHREFCLGLAFLRRLQFLHLNES